MKRLAYLLLPASLILSGCSLLKNDKPVETAVKPVTKADIANWQTSGTWKLVGKNPDTYYPAGVAAGIQTGFRDGEWVEDPTVQPRFFVPRKGTPSKSQEQLIAEATAIVNSMANHKLLPSIPTPSLPEVKMPKLPKIGKKG